MNVKRMLSIAVLGAFCFIPTSAFASIVDNEISPLAWYDNLPRITTRSGTVSSSVTTESFPVHDIMFTVSNCGAAYHLILDQEDDEVGWAEADRSKLLPADTVNEYSFTSAGLDLEKKCVLRIHRFISGAATGYSMTVFDAS